MTRWRAGAVRSGRGAADPPRIGPMAPIYRKNAAHKGGIIGGRRGDRRSFFVLRTAQKGPRTASGPLNVWKKEPRSRKSLANQAINGRRADPPAPEVSGSRRRNDPGNHPSAEVMLSDFKCSCLVYLACGHTDLRRGIDGLAGLADLTLAVYHRRVWP